jgi:glycosyltransferase involved in cell wall biosynthesis
MSDLPQTRISLPLIAVVIPVFNEETNIETVIDEIQTLKSAIPQWRIVPIVVDDASTDQTGGILERLAHFHDVRIVSLPIHLGIGGAVQAGFRYAVALGADVTLQLDGDGQHPSSEIPGLVAPILAGDADVVVGSRYLPRAGGIVSGRWRRLGTRLFSLLLKLLVDVRVADATSGFRAFGRDAGNFVARCYSDDYPEVQAYVPLARRGFKIHEIPVRMRPRHGGASSITPARSAYYMVKVAFATMIDVVRPLPPRQEDPNDR